MPPGRGASLNHGPASPCQQEAREMAVTFWDLI